MDSVGTRCAGEEIAVKTNDEVWKHQNWTSGDIRKCFGCYKT